MSHGHPRMELTDLSSRGCRSINAARTNGDHTVTTADAERERGGGHTTHGSACDMKRASRYLVALVAGPVTALATAGVAAATPAAPVTGASTLPSVDMEATVLASQIDP